MKMLLTPFIVTTLLLTARAADRCGDRCTSTQVCSDDGICVNKSDLVTCGAWHLSYYCHKGYECCGYQGCMPVGEVCCDSIFYCPGGSTCCGSMDCCGAGTVCNRKGKCVLDKYSTRKPSTTRSVYTRTPSTTARKIVRTTRTRTPFPTESRTRYPTFKTRWFDDYTTRRSFRVLRTSYSTFRWWHVIIVVTVVTVSVIVAAVIRNRRNSALNAPGYPGTGGMVLK